MTINKQISLIALLLSIGLTVVAESESTSLNYRTFCDRLEKGEIVEFTIYRGLEVDVDATAMDVNGNLYIVNRPFRYEEDEIFLKHLDSKGITTMILDKEYQGDLPSTDRFGGWMFTVTSLSFILIPLLLVVALVKMANTISRQAKTIERLINKKATPSDLYE